MTPYEIIDYVSENNPDALMFRDPDFLDAIIGYTENEEGNFVIVYNYNKMIESLAKEYKCDSHNAEIDAVEWIEYNTMRTLPYMNIKGRPVIIYN